MGHGFEIHQVTREELPAIIDWFATSYYDNRRDAEAHFADHFDGQGATFIARCGQDIAGYITVALKARIKDIPCIVNFVVFEPYRRHGLGSRLMDIAEAYLAKGADKVVLWVPIIERYGPAQRLYAKRGYIPDGDGVVKNGVPVKEGETHRIDEDLLLCLVKDLEGSTSHAW
jgi:GNAT superfamily N-acetyltransferase